MDFLITDSGDLLFEEVGSNKALKISFKKSNKNDLRISFKTPHIGHGDPEIGNRLRVSFLTTEDTQSYASEANNKVDIDRQKLLIALRSERGEIKGREWLGSKLQEAKHSYIRKDLFLRKIEDEVKEAIKHIIPNAKIEAKRERSNDYYGVNNVSVYIYSNSILIFKFYL